MSNVLKTFPFNLTSKLNKNDVPCHKKWGIVWSGGDQDGEEEVMRHGR